MTQTINLSPRFLIIQLRQVGDVLISTTLCETLKKNYPNAQVDYVVYPYTAAMAKNNPYIDNLWVVPNGSSLKKIGQLFNALKRMRQQKYDYAIEILNTPKSIWLARLSGAKTIIGQQSTKPRTRHYDIKVEYTPDFLADDNACHSVKNRLCLLQPIAKDLEYTTQYKIHLTAKEKAKADLLLRGEHINADQPLFFFSFGTRSPNTKQWALNNFIDVINYCQKTYNAQIIACPAPGEEEDARYVQNNIFNPNNLSIFNNTTLRELAAVIAKCNIFVGNDSGPQHIAFALDIPSVSICSPSIYYPDWRPKNNPRHISVNIQNILELSDDEYEQQLINQTVEQTKKLYKIITPEIVKNKIDLLYESVV